MRCYDGRNGSVYKDVLHRLESIESKREDPVKLYYLFRLPDGTEVKKRVKEGMPGASVKDIRKWEEDTGAMMIDIIIDVKD